MGQIANSMAKRKMTHSLKVQSKYDESNRECRGKGRNDTQAESAEQIQWVRPQKPLQRKAEHTRCRAGMDGSGREWHGKRRNDVHPEGAERKRWVRS